MRTFLSVLFFGLVHLSVYSQKLACDSLIAKLTKAEKATNLIYYEITKNEEGEDGWSKDTRELWIQKSPFKMVVKIPDGKHTHYLLYDSEVEEEEAVYIPDGFPFTNLWLNIDGSLIRSKGHYSIRRSSFRFILELVGWTFDVIPGGFSCSQDEKLFWVKAEAPNFRYVKHTVKQPITVDDLAYKLKVGSYLILKANAHLDDFSDVVEEETILVPSHYAKTVSISFDKRNELPKEVKLYDDKGLYEHYLFKNVKVNPVVPKQFFTVDYLDDL